MRFVRRCWAAGGLYGRTINKAGSQSRGLIHSVVFRVSWSAGEGIAICGVAGGRGVRRSGWISVRSDRRPVGDCYGWSDFQVLSLLRRVWPVVGIADHAHVPAHRSVRNTWCITCGVGLVRHKIGGRVCWLTSRGCADVVDGRRLVEGDGMTYGGRDGLS